MKRRLLRLILGGYQRQMEQAMRESDAVSAQSKAFAEFAKRNGCKGEPYVCYLGAEGQRDGRQEREYRIQNTGDRREETGDSSQKARQAGCSEPDMASQPEVRFFYGGSLGRIYDVETVVEAARVLSEKKGAESGSGGEWTLRIAGAGEKESWLRDAIQDLPNVQFLGYLNEEAYRIELSEADMGLIPMNPDSQVAVPYKLADYLSHGLAVISSLPGEAEELLKECGLRYRFGDARSLSLAMEQCLCGPMDWASSRDKAQSIFRENFDRGVTYPAFAKWVVGVTGE